MSKKPTNYESNESNARIFNNPVLNFIGKTHISLPLIIFFGSGIFLLFYASYAFHIELWRIAIYFLSGLIFFTLFEYLMHRFLYHLPGVYEEGNIQHALHGIHHKFPRDKKLLVMPPVLSVLLGSIILGINYIIFAESGFAFTGGFLFGYATYLSVHYIVHAFKPPKSIFKELWINHSIHHYHDDEKAFGVSSPLWDYIFGTMPDKRKLKKNN